MPIKRGKKQKKKKKKAFLKAVDDFVTSNTEEKFDVLIRICEEAKERFLIELLDKYQCSNEQMIEILVSKHPAFALARFCAVLKKNTLAAVLLSKSHELFQALADDWEHPEEITDKEAKVKKALETIKKKDVIKAIIENVNNINVVTRHIVARFILLRLEDGDLTQTDSLSFTLTRKLGENHAILSSWVKFCRNDDQSPLGVTTMRGLFLLARDKVLKETICDIGGVEGFITRYDRQSERLVNLRKIAAEKQIIKDKAIATSNKRRKQLLVTKEILSDAETEAMRGLKEAKLQVKKIKMTLKKEEKLYKDGAEAEQSATSISADADLAVKMAIEQFIIIIRCIGMLVLNRPELQSLVLEYEIFLDILEIIRVESDDLQKYALETLGACADKSTDCQVELRKARGLETVLAQLNDKEKSPSYRVLASNVLYQCIDGNSESGDYVCELGILPGLCQMLHTLHENIHKHEKRVMEKADDGDSDDMMEEKEGGDPLESVECGVRILMTCATSNEKNRNQILSQNVVLPLLALTKSSIVSIVLVSTQCLVNLLDGSSSTQQVLVDNDGISTLLALLQRFDENTNLTIVRCAAKALYVAIEKHSEAQLMARDVGCVERISIILKTTSLDELRMDMNKLIAVATDSCEENQNEILHLDTLKSIVVCCAHSFGTSESRAAAAWAYGCAVEKHVALKLDGCRIGAPTTLVELISEGLAEERTSAAIGLSKAMEDDLLSKDLTLKSNGMYELIRLLKADSENERCAATVALLNLCRNNNHCVQKFRNANGLEPLVDMLNVKERSLRERIACVKCLTVLIIGSVENKEKISAYGGVPALVQILLHGETENCVQFALIYITRWAFVRDGQDELREEKQGIIPRIVELVKSTNELTQRTACHCAYQISKGNLENQSLLIQGGIVPLLVSMVRPPMSVGPQTASWCIAALGEIAQDDGSRDVLRNEGAAACLMDLGTRAENEYLRRSASEVYAACTTPGWTFADGTPEFDSQLSISSISSKPWIHGLQSKSRLKELLKINENTDEGEEGIVGLTGFGDEFLISIEPPPSMTQPKNSDPNVRPSKIPKYYRSTYCGKDYKRQEDINAAEVRIFRSNNNISARGSVSSSINSSSSNNSSRGKRNTTPNSKNKNNTTNIVVNKTKSPYLVSA